MSSMFATPLAWAFEKSTSSTRTYSSRMSKRDFPALRGLCMTFSMMSRLLLSTVAF